MCRRPTIRAKHRRASLFACLLSCVGELRLVLRKTSCWDRAHCHSLTSAWLNGWIPSFSDVHANKRSEIVVVTDILYIAHFRAAKLHNVSEAGYASILKWSAVC